MTRELYAIDDDLPVPGRMTHYIIDGGLRMESVFENADGVATFGVGWDTLEKAQANYEAARQSLLMGAKLIKVAERLIELREKPSETDTSRLKALMRTRWGKLTLFTNTGPPAWWLPKIGLVKYGIRAGWIRGCFELKWEHR